MKEKNNQGIPPTEVRFLSHEKYLDSTSGKMETTSILTRKAVIDEEKYKKFFSHKCSFDEAIANATHIPEGDLGGKYTYFYQEFTIGTAISIRCHCGIEEDITDYDSF